HAMSGSSTAYTPGGSCRLPGSTSAALYMYLACGRTGVPASRLAWIDWAAAYLSLLSPRVDLCVRSFRNGLEKPIHDAVLLLRLELGGELRRASDVGEQHRHLLALPFQS